MFAFTPSLMFLALTLFVSQSQLATVDKASISLINLIVTNEDIFEIEEHFI